MMIRNYVEEVIKGFSQGVQDQIRNAPNGDARDTILVRAIQERREREGVQPFSRVVTTEEHEGTRYLYPEMVVDLERSRRSW